MATLKLMDGSIKTYDTLATLTTTEEADQYYELLVALSIGVLSHKYQNNDVREEAEDTVRDNINYWAGRYCREITPIVQYVLDTYPKRDVNTEEGD